MSVHNDWLASRKEQVVFLLTLLCSAGFLLSNDSVQVHTLRSWMFAGFGIFLDKIAVINRYDELYEENRRLRERTVELMLQNSRLREAELENNRLHDLLDFKNKSSFDLVPAKIIGKQQTGLIRTIVIAAGSRDNVVKNQAVVTADGLVGKVYNTGSSISNVQLLFDRNYRVSAMVQRSRALGIMRVNGYGRLELAEVPKHSDIVTGDLVITSGLSLTYPSGLRIGKVSEIVKEQPGMFMRVVLQPVVDTSKLEEVFVIRNVGPEITVP
jgi:rod shape-determining protein MreC